MKKIGAFILCLSILVLVCSVYTGAVDGVVDGDADANGLLDTRDVRLYLKNLVADESTDNICDLNGDNVVDTLDVRILIDAVMTTVAQKERLIAFETPVNSSLSYDEIESHRVARIVHTYEEFEEVCAAIRPNFYTPYEGKNGSFDAWTETITPAYFEKKSLFIFLHGTPASEFDLEYTVSNDTVDLTIQQSGYHSFGCLYSWHLIVEIDKEHLVDRRMILHLQ